MRKLTRKMRLLHGHEDAETKTASMKIGEDQKFTKCGVPGKLLKERVHKRIRMQIASVSMDCPVDSRYRACMRTVLAMGLDWAVPPRRIAEESLSLVGISRELQKYRKSDAHIGTAFPKWSLE